MFLRTRRYFQDHWHSLLIGIILTSLVVVLYPFFAEEDVQVEVVAEEPTQETVFDPAALLIAPEPSEIEVYNKMVAEVSEDEDILSIGDDCSMSPLVLRARANSIIAVENNDNVGHSIVFENQEEDAFTFSLPAELTLDFVPKVFGLSKGIYRYRCDNVEGSVNNGVMHIVD